MDFNSAFLESVEADKDVYVVTPGECEDRITYWLLLTASYGLAKASAKIKMQSITLFLDSDFNN